MRSFGLGLIAVAATACTTAPCKPGTAFLSYTLTNGAEAADTIDVTLAIAGAAAQTMSVPRKTTRASGSIEVDFGSYPSGQPLAFTVAARLGSQVLASTSQAVTSSAGCTALSFTLDGSQGDLGPSDMLPPGVAVARLIAPMSTSTVTQQKPTLRWVLSPGDGTPVVDLCKDRACTQPLTITAPVANNNTSAVPTAGLPPGWVYWRVRVASGNQTATSATWQFWVGKQSATQAVDASNGTVLDVNGDGYADFLIGAPDTGSNAGVAHLYLGNGSGGSFQRIDLTNPDGPDALYGGSVKSAGDVNGDGYADFLISASAANSNAGTAHLYLGEAIPIAADWNGTTPSKRIDLSSPDDASAHFGQVASAGDVNRDGYADFIVSARLASSGAGAVHFYLGAPTPNAADWNGTSASNRIDLANPDGANAGFGVSISGAGDVNGDGYGDFIVGATGAGSGAGAAHLYLGGATPNANEWNGPSPSKRTDLISPDDANANYGGCASAGDVNGDGYADFLVSGYLTGSNAGAVHLYLGEASLSTSHWNGTSPPRRVDLTDPDGGTNDQFGNSLASAGDVNGDGYADFIVGAWGANSVGGAAHLYLGQVASNPSDWNGPSPSRRIDLANPDGAGAQLGFSLSSAGDVNGDGYADFLIGAYRASSLAGAAHLYIGEPTPSTNDWNGISPSKRVDLPSPDGANSEFGTSVANAAESKRRMRSRDPSGSAPPTLRVCPEVTDPRPMNSRLIPSVAGPDDGNKPLLVATSIRTPVSFAEAGNAGGSVPSLLER